MFVVSTFSELQESRHVLASVGGPEEEKQRDGSKGFQNTSLFESFA